MRSIIRHPITAACAFAATGLIFVACSESPTAPTGALRAPTGIAALDSASTGLLTIPGGSTVINVLSNGGAATQYCGIAAGEFAPNFATTVFVGSCGLAQDLEAAIEGTYNPGWDHPLTVSAPSGSSDWIGPTGADAQSNEYRARPGTYKFTTTFTIPAGATGVGLNLRTLGDNVVEVWLNGHPLGANNPIQDCPTLGPCYWFDSDALAMVDANQAHFNIAPVAAGLNTITFFLIDTRIGVGPAGSPAPPGFNTHSCHLGPQSDGELGFSGVFNVMTSPNHQAAGWNETDCLNPTGLDFAGQAFYTPAPPAANHGCTLGFWKQHDGNGPQANVWPSPFIPGPPNGTTLAGAGFTNTGNQTVTMDDALGFKGGNTVQDAKNLLMKQAVAALLNASTTGMNYPLDAAHVLSEVNTALATGDRNTILAEASRLEGFNSLEGPLC